MRGSIATSNIQRSTPATIAPRFTRVIASDSAWIGIPDLSPDNRWVVYVARSADSSYSLWLVNSAGGEPTRLTSGRFVDMGPIWFPSGDRIAFISNRAARDGGSGFYLMSLSIDPQTGVPNGPLRQLTMEPVGGFGAPSPDGSSVAFPSVPTDSVSHVMVVGSDGGVARQIASYRAEWARSGPEFLWSSTGDWIFHIVRSATGTNVLMRVSAANGATEKVREFVPQIAHPDQTGRFVLLRMSRDTVSSAGGALAPNHEIAAIDGQPIARFAAPRGMWIYRFSADGRSLIAQQTDSSRTSVWLLDIGNLLQGTNDSR